MAGANQRVGSNSAVKGVIIYSSTSLKWRDSPVMAQKWKRCRNAICVILYSKNVYMFLVIKYLKLGISTQEILHDLKSNKLFSLISKTMTRPPSGTGLASVCIIMFGHFKSHILFSYTCRSVIINDFWLSGTANATQTCQTRGGLTARHGQGYRSYAGHLMKESFINK